MQNRGTKLFSPCFGKVVERGYCAFPGVGRDLMRAGLRPEPAFAAIRAVIECQNWLLAERAAGQLPDGFHHDRRIRGVGNMGSSQAATSRNAKPPRSSGSQAICCAISKGSVTVAGRQTSQFLGYSLANA
jgi:hypothetical protein